MKKEIKEFISYILAYGFAGLVAGSVLAFMVLVVYVLYTSFHPVLAIGAAIIEVAVAAGHLLYKAVTKKQPKDIVRREPVLSMETKTSDIDADVTEEQQTLFVKYVNEKYGLSH